MKLSKLMDLASRPTSYRALSAQLYSWSLKMGQCDLCAQTGLSQALLCQHCLADLPLFNYQNLDGNLLNWPAIDKLFPKREFDQLMCLSPYIWPFDQWLKQYKYQGRFELQQLFSSLLNNLWQQLQPHSTADNCLLLSIPLHVKKWQQRGYNQAHLIAKVFAENNQLTYHSSLLLRTIYNQGQVGQTGKQRRKNLKNAFEIKACPERESLPEHVYLLDDVITTGTTVNEVCKLLKAHGVKTITVITIALSLP
jgi:ComF family protein